MELFIGLDDTATVWYQRNPTKVKYKLFMKVPLQLLWLNAYPQMVHRSAFGHSPDPTSLWVCVRTQLRNLKQTLYKVSAKWYGPGVVL
jgi:hypothetical protein